jgi:4-hydroxymandelate oxidase
VAVFEQLESAARAVLPPEVYDTVAAGAGTEAGLAANLAAWAGVCLRPRRLVDVSAVRTAGQVLGVPVSVPVLLAPTGRHRLVHPEGELAAAAAVQAEGTVMCLATRSTTDVHEVVPIAPGRVWLQVYVATDRGYTSEVLHAAREAGVQRVVITVDRPIPATRPRAELHGPVVLPEGITDASHLGAGVARPTGLEYDLALTFEDLAWIAGHGVA